MVIKNIHTSALQKLVCIPSTQGIHFFGCFLGKFVHGETVETHYTRTQICGHKLLMDSIEHDHTAGEQREVDEDCGKGKGKGGEREDGDGHRHKRRQLTHSAMLPTKNYAQN